MKKILSKTFLLIFVICLISSLQAETGLLVIVHGSPSDNWNKTLVNFGNSLSSQLKKEKIHLKTKLAFMEFVKPTIADRVKEFENEGIKKVIVLPLFIAPSSHSSSDIPNILDISFSPTVRSSLKEEGIKIVKSNIKFTLLPTLNYGRILENIMLKRVKLLSKSPESEALVILYHGSPMFEKFWRKECRSVGTYIAAKTGIDSFTGGGVKMGDFNKIFSLIKEASANKKRVLVIGLYVASSPLSFYKRYMNKNNYTIHEKIINQELKNIEVVYSGKSVLPSKELISRVIKLLKQLMN